MCFIVIYNTSYIQYILVICIGNMKIIIELNESTVSKVQEMANKDKRSRKKMLEIIVEEGISND